MKNLKVFSLLLAVIFVFNACKKDKEDDNTDPLEWEHVASWGSGGTGNNQYNLISGMAVDAAGNQYISDMNQWRVQKISNNGNYITQWGEVGNVKGKFQTPRGVAINSASDIFVVDQSYDCANAPDCMDIAGIDFGPCALVLGYAVYDDTCRLISGCNKTVNGVNYAPYFSVDMNECITSCLNIPKSRVQKFSSSGNYLAQFGRCGTADGRFMFPIAIAIDKNDVIYVTDSDFNNRIQKFSPQGAFILAWTLNNTLGNPQNIAIDSNNDVYVLFTKYLFPQKNEFSVTKYNPQGTVMMSWTKTLENDGEDAVSMAFDSKGNLHIGSSEGEIFIYKTDGTLIKKWGEKGVNEGQILGLQTIRFDSNDNLYIAGCAGNSNCRISKFKKKL